MGNELTFWVAIFNGFLSFFTPCVLPLLPLYFSYLAGTTITNLENNKDIRKIMIINAIAFVLGLSILNITLGFGAKVINDTLVRYQDSIRKVGGILVIIFGLYFLGVFKIKLFNKEKKYHYKNYSPNFLKSLLLGITFSFGWTPCNGPIIGTILFLASFEKDYMRAGFMMLVYSIGFAIPFLISALLLSRFINNYKRIYKYFDKIKFVAGLLMIIMGIMLYTNTLSLLVVSK
ncbi:cytochrome C biogenesis protein CcdA [Vallitalea longa]|uniref:Cytochrome C biogenesis protein CcdA n=1 Tax=Vallitalea longa TaxID=2936439 RepID=A0A9W5YG58_9FIRM|nr:cytochrome c biogenesis protein CcdA [Vallitalea longa]GKX31314.1 cytochrome C biogenesis protein CcdA [Vallitalea longa]